MPEDMPTITINDRMLVDGKIDIIKIITTAGFATSNSEARRLVAQGAVRINGVKVNDIWDVDIENGDVIQSGKRNFIKVIF